MVYSSLLFIYGFLPISLLIYYVTPKKLRNAVLLLLSMVFCGLISLYFLVFMAVYTLINYTAGILTERKNKIAAAIPLAGGIIFDLTAILVFRTEYFSWLKDIIRAPEGFFPVGISFFTLSAVGTLIDVYCGRIKAERNLIQFGLYFLFFPKLLMGPVLRYGSFSKILSRRKCGLNEIGVGFTIFVKGLAKKIIVADNLYMLYMAVKSIEVTEMPALTAWLGIIAYLLCLYFTLSGFADMGTGIGYCFGIRLPQSFSYPMFSTKIRYFTARWHMQVTSWFRRYVTRPLCSVSRSRIYQKLIFIIVWAIAGYWYGFSVNGIIWGLILGTAIVIENRFSSTKILRATSVLYTFLIVLVCFVFFSGESLEYSLRYMFAMIGGSGLLADTLLLHLLKSYTVIILIAVYSSTNLFRNMIMRSGKTKLGAVFTAASPLVVLLMFIICTAFISFSGSSEMMLMKL